jgi:hypothetical protein
MSDLSRQRSRGCSHEWVEMIANLARADVGYWRWRCVQCGAYRNDAGRVVEPHDG